MSFSSNSLLCLLVSWWTATAFVELRHPTRQPQNNSCRSSLHISLFATSTASTMEDLTFETPDTTGIQEQACIDAANRMKRIAVPVSTDISPSGSVGISYIHWPAAGSNKRQKTKAPPLILLHGFDSSGLEYRRLGPQLASQGIDAYAVDTLGWGFTQLSGVTSFSANAKVEALKSTVRILVGSSSPFVVAGASLGGAAAIELAAALSDAESDSPCTCAGLILIDAQGFVDGVGPMAKLPKVLAQAGVAVLKSVPLRNMANKMSYFDVDIFATEEAQVIGRLHCLREGWSDAMVSFMQSGGFSPSSKISKIISPALVLWGRQDGILDGEEFAYKFKDELSNARLQWIDECGHVPHLEKPEETANAIASFLTSTDVAFTAKSTGKGNQSSPSTTEDSMPNYYIGGGVLGAFLLEELIKQFY